MTIARISNLLDSPIKGNFDTPHLQEMHQYIFQDVYPFAGKFRTENISKGSFVFAQVRFLESTLESLSGELKQENHLQGLSKIDFATRSAYYLAELNVIHFAKVMVVLFGNLFVV
jgi:cell filamentation protein